METVVEQNRVEVDGRVAEEARARVEAYLRAWKLPDSVREEVVAMAIACVEERLERDAECEQLRVAIEEAEKAARARTDKLVGAVPPLVPKREPETHPMTMETSLTRLPSFRILAGWFLLIALIVLAFIFTR